MSDIRSEAEAICDRIRDLRGEIDIEIARLRVVQARCKHPNKYQYSAMGELGLKCPDCGWAT